MSGGLLVDEGPLFQAVSLHYSVTARIIQYPFLHLPLHFLSVAEPPRMCVCLIIVLFFPPEILRIIQLDLDLKYKTNIRELFEEFDNFLPGAVIGIAREMQPVYRYVAAAGGGPPGPLLTPPPPSADGD